MGAIFSKKESAADKANKKLEIPDDISISDKREIFKLKFPFYRMEIDAFAFKLNEIVPEYNFKTRSAISDGITIKQLQETFCELPTFERSWDRVEKLLQ
jgi:hypothetical protein